MKRSDRAAASAADGKQRNGARQDRKARLATPFAALCLVVCALVPALATADEEGSGTSANPALTPQALQEGLSSGTRSSEIETTDPQAAEQMPHRDLGRDEALELLQSVFPPALEGPAGVFDELHVEKFLSDNAAVIAAGDQPQSSGVTIGSDAPKDQYDGPTLLESALPLRTEDPAGNEAVVDLGLEHSEGELQAANPLVEVGLPTELGEGISLADAGVQVELAGAPESLTPSTVDQSVAFYPNVAEDTDLAVALTPTGAETLTQLRSADSPHSQTFHLDLPEGASLEATDEGGAKVVRGSEALIDVQPPSALDANGEEVPVTLEVSGDSIVLRVSPGDSAAFPILVDPIYDYYNWNQTHSSTGISDWASGTTTASYQPLPYSYGASPYEPGLGLVSGFYGSAAPWSQAGWSYVVPRYESDFAKYGTRPTSFIESMTLTDLWFSNQGNAAVNPYLNAGLWNESVGWAYGNPYIHTGAEGNLSNGYTTYYFPGNNNHNIRSAAIALTTYEYEGQAKYRNVFVGNALIVLGDVDVPKFGSVTSPGWTDGSSLPPIGYTVSDSGLGVQSVVLTKGAEYLGGNSIMTGLGGACGQVSHPCPYTWSSSDPTMPTVSYDISKLPQGVNNLALTASDPVGNVSAPATAQLKVDRTAPELSVWGTPYYGASYEPAAEPLKLGIKATDGSSSSPQSGMGSLEVLVDGKLVNSATCAAQNCEISREWEWSAESYSVGEHTAVVKATDRVGHVATRTINFQIYHDAKPPTVLGPEELSGLLNAPSGWLNEGVNHFYTIVSDSESGIKSVQILIDGSPAELENPACEPAEYSPFYCNVLRTYLIDTSQYSAGAHSVHVVSEDKRGNQTEAQWTIRISPNNNLTAQEATETLEAYEETSPEVSPVASTEEVIGAEEIEDGNDPGLEQNGAQLESTGTPAPSTIETGSGEMTIETPEGTIGIDPIQPESSEDTPELTEEVAVVTPNTANSVDTVVRPKFNGLMTFQSIRDSTAPEEYSWEVELGEGQTMEAIDSQDVGVYYEDGTEAVLIETEPAHDATGAAVPTSISVSDSDIITLTVNHRSGGYVYPVLAGSSFEVGTAEVIVYTPPAAEPEVVEVTESAPVPEPSIPDPDPTAGASSARTTKHKDASMTKCQTEACWLGFWEMHFKERFLFNGKEHIPGGQAWHDEGDHTWHLCKDYSSTQPWSIEPNSCIWIGNHAHYGNGGYICAQDVWHANDHLSSEFHAMTFHNYGDGYVGKKQNSDCSPS